MAQNSPARIITRQANAQQPPRPPRQPRPSDTDNRPRDTLQSNKRPVRQAATQHDRNKHLHSTPTQVRDRRHHTIPQQQEARIMGRTSTIPTPVRKHRVPRTHNQARLTHTQMDNGRNRKDSSQPRRKTQNILRTSQTPSRRPESHHSNSQQDAQDHMDNTDTKRTVPDEKREPLPGKA